MVLRGSELRCCPDWFEPNPFLDVSTRTRFSPSLPLSEVMLWLLLISLVSVNLLTRYNQLEAVNFEGMFPKASPYEKVIKGKRVMVLQDDVGIYSQNRLAGYFPDWSLSAGIFEQPDYYENILLIDEVFRTDPPEIIIDPKDLMKKIFERIPRVKPLYKREGELYKRINN